MIAQNDPRYKNGVFTNTAGQRREAAGRRRNWQAQNHPVSNGWTLDRWSDDDLAIYRQGPFELHRVYDPPCAGWLVVPPGCDRGQFFPEAKWSVSEITAELELFDTEPMSEAETEQRQTEWKAAHPADALQDLGVRLW